MEYHDSETATGVTERVELFMDEVVPVVVDCVTGSAFQGSCIRHCN